MHLVILAGPMLGYACGEHVGGGGGAFDGFLHPQGCNAGCMQEIWG